MRKILTSFALVAASLAFAQVGVNNDKPKATLDVKAKEATGTTTGTDGILIPRVDRERAQAMQNVEHSTLIYVDNVTSGAQSGQASQIDAKGFYYFDTDVNSGEWVKLGGGATATVADDVSLYAKNGTLSGDRVVTHNNNDLTFTTGTGEFIIDGNSRLNGGSHVRVTKLDQGTDYTVTADDYLITVDGPSSQFIVKVPNPEDAKGRVLIFTNKTANKLVLNLASGQQAINTSGQSQIAAGKAEWIVSDGTKWYNLINY